MMMPVREYQAQPSRFGFNGKENDNDVKGFGNQQDYGMRIYDTRIGKFLSVDPISVDFPELTPYQFASNSPIKNIDLDGLEAVEAEEVSPSKQSPLRIVPKEPGKVIPLNPNKNSSWERGTRWLKDKLKPLVDRIKNFQKPTPTLPLRPGTPIPVPHDDPNGQPVPIPIHKPYSHDPKPGDTKMPQKNPQGSPGVLPEPDPEKDDDDDGQGRDKLIYRRGLKTDWNFTPRDKDATTGLSANVNPYAATQGKGGKVQALSVSMLRTLGFIVKFDKGGHVSIRTRTQKEMDEWIASRNNLQQGVTGQENAHTLTKLAQTAVVSSIELPKIKEP